MENFKIDFSRKESSEATCIHHGAYTATLWPNGVWSECQTCEQQEREKRVEFEELQAKEQKRKSMLLAARIPKRFERKTLSDFEAKNANQQAMYADCLDYAKNFERNLELGRCLIFSGPPGVGKTHLAIGIALQALEKGWKAKYLTASDLIKEIRATWGQQADSTELQVIKSFVEPELLIIDEIGVQSGTDAERNSLFDVVDRRYLAMRPTIICSNHDKDGIEAMVGARIIDRLRENGGKMLLFKGESQRGGKNAV